MPSPEFDALATQARSNEDAEAAAATLLTALSAKLLANPTPAQVTALGTELKASADTLAAAIVANTPAA
jgi:hypothetical protein